MPDRHRPGYYRERRRKLSGFTSGGAEPSPNDPEAPCPDESGPASSSSPLDLDLDEPDTRRMYRFILGRLKQFDEKRRKAGKPPAWWSVEDRAQIVGEYVIWDAHPAYQRPLTWPRTQKDFCQRAGIDAPKLRSLLKTCSFQKLQKMYRIMPSDEVLITRVMDRLYEEIMESPVGQLKAAMVNSFLMAKGVIKNGGFNLNLVNQNVMPQDPDSLPDYRTREVLAYAAEKYKELEHATEERLLPQDRVEEYLGNGEGGTPAEAGRRGGNEHKGEVVQGVQALGG